MDPLARQFERFRDRGDVAALGDVFDALAARLLRLALHLTRDGQDAEDLLQGTFLVAMERAASFDGEQALEPWLAGILRNLARNAWRQRRGGSQTEAAQIDARDPRPDEVASNRELREQLRQHIGDLPVEQRQALTLQMEHGLQPAEIAAVLELPPGTVRMRLQRGRDALRKLLPAHLTTLLGAATLGGGLGSVRAQVLAAGAQWSAAATATGSTAALTLTGALLMTKLAAACLLLALTAWGAFALLADPDAPQLSAPTQVAAADTTSSSGSAARSGDASDQAGVASPTRDPERLPLPPSAPEATASMVRLRGRVEDLSGAPVRGVRATLETGPRRGVELDRRRIQHGSLDWDDPEPLETDSEGRFEFHFAHSAALRHLVRLRGDGRVDASSPWVETSPGETITLTDLVMPSGARVRGRIVDVSGRPVAGADVQLIPRDAEPEGTKFGFLYSGRSDETGQLEIRTLVPPGRHSLRVPGREVRQPEGDVVVSTGEQALRIVVAETPDEPRVTIRGIVRDEDGRGVPGASVFSYLIGAHESAGSDRPSVFTDRKGRFELERSLSLAHEATTQLTVFRSGYVATQIREPVRWDAEDLELLLPSGSPLDLRVVWLEDGLPVENYAINIRPVRENGRSSSDRELSHAGDHPGGRLRIDHVSPARYRIDVVAMDGVCIDQHRIIQVEPGQPATVDLRVARLRDQTIELVTPSGQPVAGAPIELLRHQTGGELSLGMMAMTPADAAMNGALVAAREATWRTGDQGRATIRYATAPGHGLRLPGPGHVPRIVQPLPTHSDEPLRIVVDGGATLRGKLGPATVWHWLRDRIPEGRSRPAYVHVVDPTGRNGMLPRPGPFFDKAGWTLDDAGCFEVHGVPPGVWQLQLGAPIFGLPLVERLEVTEGGEHELHVDLSAWAPRPVRFQVTVDGARRSVSLYASHARKLQIGNLSRDLTQHILTEEDGIATVELPAGTWTLTGRLKDEDLSVPLPERVVGIEPRDSNDAPAQQIDLAYRIGVARMRLLTPDGEPLPHTELLCLEPDATSASNWEHVGESSPTDSEGRTAIRGRPGPVLLRVIRRDFVDWPTWTAWRDAHDAPTEDRFVRIDGVTLAPGASPELELRLPPEWAEPPR